MKEEGYGETKSRSDISYCRNAVAYIWSNMFTMGLYTYRIRESIHIRPLINDFLRKMAKFRHQENQDVRPEQG